MKGVYAGRVGYGMEMPAEESEGWRDRRLGVDRGEIRVTES